MIKKLKTIFYCLIFSILIKQNATSSNKYNLVNNTNIDECIVNPSSITDFPSWIFTKFQLQRGAVILNIFAAIYFFICLAFICDKYFLPTIDRICKILNISKDVAATTFMATATTMPEFFTNTVSTFIAESDMGLSAIIGSAMFNTLGVAAIASLFIKKPIQIDWWPLTRDSILFITFLIVLVTIAWDSVIMWWETCILLLIYILYWILMLQNRRVMKYIKLFIEDHLQWCQRIKNYDIENQRPREEQVNVGVENQDTALRQNETEISNNSEKVWKIPKDASKLTMSWFFFTLPIKVLLHYTIPNPDHHKKLFPISFIMCIIWIGCTSYIVFWMVVIIGDTFEIPESVTGLTFLAFGGCMPEAISAVIVARKGCGQMGVSNALGANCLAILFSLGIPWFIKTTINGAAWSNAHIVIYSYGMEYTIIILILAVITLYVILAFHGYKLRLKVGIYLFITYAIFVTFAILMEYNLFLVGPTDEC